jgi:hypothetical protein
MRIRREEQPVALRRHLLFNANRLEVAVWHELLHCISGVSDQMRGERNAVYATGVYTGNKRLITRVLRATNSL